jgi:hypothetical protein
MTLIQTVWTNDRILQVSDRRLTANGTLVDDYYTKLVLWNERFTVGFTGLARVDRWQRESTALWMAEILADCAQFEVGCEVLKAEAQKRFKKLPKNWDLRLAVVIAGFDFREHPLVACITNMDMETNALRAPAAFEVFTPQMIAGRQVGLHVAGASLNENQTVLFHRYVRRRLKEGDGVNPPIRLMVEIQRDVSKTDPKKTVGPDALCVHIPRSTNMPNGSFSNLGGPDLPTGSTSFGFLDRRGWLWKQEAPLSAIGGFVRKFWASADPDHPDNQTVSMQLLKVPKSWHPPQNTT